VTTQNSAFDRTRINLALERTGDRNAYHSVAAGCAPGPRRSFVAAARRLETTAIVGGGFRVCAGLRLVAKKA
jgi:hypothetical protein